MNSRQISHCTHLSECSIDARHEARVERVREIQHENAHQNRYDDDSIAQVRVPFHKHISHKSSSPKTERTNDDTISLKSIPNAPSNASINPNNPNSSAFLLSALKPQPIFVEFPFKSSFHRRDQSKSLPMKCGSKPRRNNRISVPVTDRQLAHK